MELTREQEQDYRSRVRGCLLGGAVGDALGAPVEFMTLSAIRSEHGDQGIQEYVADRGQNRHGLVTDDTQMTLFTMEGMIRAGLRRDRGIGFNPVGPLHQSYLTWYETQTRRGSSGDWPGWLQGESWLYAQRAPGNTCLDALAASVAPNGEWQRYGAPAENHSKGCGGVMRSAPLGLLPPTWNDVDSAVFSWAAEAAGLTHGHPTGKLSSGALALLVHRLVVGADLTAALDTVMAELARHDHHEETASALRRARDAAATRPATPETVERLGGGWVAEEALAIAVYCALARPRPEEFLDALSLAVTHSGDCDSTGAVCGNILGALHGETALPPQLTFEVEGRGTMLQLADDFVWEFTAHHLLHGEYGPWTRWSERYRG
ncbi:ADP-ribosylglycohydrolase family protein [Halostreptopolyspora alba]|uniref:ADP-ribosylglycohydrolase family protein n=1 Tax=Halostreptopolyspora alba TaxID=2487137 RepID=A0A3N0EIH4_9ACTN|nr:ADP-ribosylglycohydrolase family protein [Nocardiopsaceae bacterium YIM 96095]